MVHICDAARCCIICRALGRCDAADAAAVDLDESYSSVVDELLSHMEVVRGLAARELHVSALCGQSRIGSIGAAEEGFLEPYGVDLFEVFNSTSGGIDVLAEDLSGVDQQCAVGADPFARGLQVVAVQFQRAASEGTPAALYCAIAAVARLAAAE